MGKKLKHLKMNSEGMKNPLVCPFCEYSDDNELVEDYFRILRGEYLEYDVVIECCNCDEKYKVGLRK